MKIVNYESAKQSRLGVVHGESVVDVALRVCADCQRPHR